MASNNMSRGDRTPDVLVVGGGPGGTATAHWLAQRGLDVIVAEKKSYPRTKTCGDGLTPRAIRQLIDMGYDFAIPELHRIEGLRAYAGELVIELPWPEHSIYPNWGAAIRRADLDMQVAALAEKQGAVIRQNTEAVPLVEDGDLVAVELRENGDPSVDAEVVVPRVTVIADGSLSRFGRELQTFRRRDYPYGLALRGYYASTNSADPFMESQLDIRDRQGMALPGYGWVFPLGDGTINVGVGVLSTFKGAKGVNTSRVMDAFRHRPARPLGDHGGRQAQQARWRQAPDVVLCRAAHLKELAPGGGRRRRDQPLQRGGHRLRVRDGEARRVGYRRDDCCRRPLPSPRLQAGARGRVPAVQQGGEGLHRRHREPVPHASADQDRLAFETAHGVGAQGDGQPPRARGTPA